MIVAACAILGVAFVAFNLTRFRLMWRIYDLMLVLLVILLIVLALVGGVAVNNWLFAVLILALVLALAGYL